MNELPFRPDDTSLIEDEIDCVIDSGIERGATLFEEMREFIEDDAADCLDGNTTLMHLWHLLSRQLLDNGLDHKFLIAAVRRS
jgi:hypothetical protein